MRKLTLVEKLYVYGLVPLVGAITFAKMQRYRRDNNPIHSDSKLTGFKQAAFSKDYSVNEIKRVSKNLGVTINDVLMTITSISLKQYMV